MSDRTPWSGDELPRQGAGGSSSQPYLSWRALAASTGLLLILTLLKLRFAETLGHATPFLLYFVTVLFASWYGGWRTGLVTTVLAAVLGTYFFLPAFDAFDRDTTNALIRLVVFLAEATAITLITARAQSARLRATALAREARGSLAKLESVLAKVDDGITVQSAAGEILYANLPAARMSGFDDVAAFLSTPMSEVVSRFEILTPEGKPFPVDQLPGRRVLAGLPAPETLVRFRVRATGAERWTLLRASLAHLSGDDKPCAVNVFHDLTELRARDEQLRVSQEWFETALRSIGDAVVATDNTGHVTFLNPIAERLTGWPAADAKGQPLAAVFHILNETTRAPVESPVDRVLREGRVVGLANHTVLIARDGGEVSIDDSAAPIRNSDGKLVGAVLVFRDVSAARNEERKQRFLSEANSALSSSLDYDKTLAMVTRQAVPAIADWCAVDIADGDDLRRVAVEHIDPSKVQLVLDVERRYPGRKDESNSRYRILKTGEPLLIPEIPDEMLVKVAQDGEHLALMRQLQLSSFLGVPLAAHGRVVGVLSMAMAESHRKYGPEDLALAKELADRAGLAVANAQLYAEAANARDQAEEANRSKDEFLAMLGHELRNPLAPIVTALQLMRLRGGDVFEKERSIIERQVRHVITLVDDLLDISRITRGKVVINKVTIDLADVVTKALELAGPMLEERKHSVEVSVPRGLLIAGDSARLAQVVTNLLTNSAKYTNPGGKIVVRAGASNGEIKLSVRDNGVGIDAELLPRVFDLFVQGRQALDRSKGGLGLGLAIVRSVVALHGGRVSVHSDGHERGSEFTVVLPELGVAAAPPTPTPVTSPAVPPRTGRVLVVDDNPDALELLLEGLQLQGYQAAGVGDAASALALAETFTPDVALLDIGLPVIDGYELARRLRALPGLQRLKLAALTGYGQISDKERAKEAGFDEHLVKPISLDQVDAAIVRLLGRTRK
ncbi:MAG TPA: ATP-binding protein [Polyangia bacterium]